MSTGPIDSLEQVLEYLVTHDIEDETIYEALEQIDLTRAKRILQRLQRIEEMKAPKLRGAAKQKFEGKRSRIKGRLYESLVGSIIQGIRCFAAFSNVVSATNELDILVTLGPRAMWVPALRNWGTHCICECKYHSTYVATDWVAKLNTVLQNHKASVGILFSRKGVAPKGNGAKIRQSLQLLAAGASPRFIVCISWDDLVNCIENGQRFLKLVVTRYVEVQAGLERLELAVVPVPTQGLPSGSGTP